MNNIIKSIVFRFKNWKTTVGGGVLGLVGASLISKLEESTGCHFQEAFAGIDWVQIIVYILTQIFGIITTDANKKIDN